MPGHTFGIESHGVEDGVVAIKQVLVGRVNQLFVVEQANGTFITIQCATQEELCEAMLLAEPLCTSICITKRSIP